MNDLQRGLLALIRSAVTGKEEALPAGFALEQARDLIIQHKIEGLAYEGAVRCGISKQEPVMKELFKRYYQQIMLSQKQNAAIEKVQRAFDENGIDYLPVKGCKIQRFYPGLGTRTMGDADILIRIEQYSQIVPIMESLDFQEVKESDHELVWQNKELFLELHKRVIPSYNKDFYAYFGEGWQLAECRSGSRYAMRAEDEMVFLFTHFAKHYRDGGIGYRYVTDLWVFRNANPNMDEEYIRATLEKLYLAEFYENILRLIDVWFADAPTDEKMDYMTDFIFASGSWGVGQSRTLANAVKNKQRSGVLAKLRYVWSILFPPVVVLSRKYTVLKKHPWMLPLVWLIRPFYKVLFEVKSLKRQKDNLGVLTKEEIRHRREMLNFVGLDYHF